MIRVYVVFICFLAGIIYAGDNAGAFIEKGISARASAMGMSYTAVADDSHAVYWNPAGLARIGGADIQFQGTHAFDASYLSLQSAFSLTRYHLGLHYVGAHADGGFETIASESHADVFEKTGRTLAYRADALYAGIGTSLRETVSVGVSGKVLCEEAASYRATGFGMDLGVLVTPLESVDLGLNMQNILRPKMSWNTPSRSVDTVPRRLKLGVQWAVIPQTWRLSSDVVLQNRRSMVLNVGTEYWLLNAVALRGGFEDGALSLGTGIRHAGISVDVSWMRPTFEELDTVYRFSVGFQLGKERI